MQSPNSIQQVIDQLKQIINWCRTNNSRMGYFACLYLRMTEAVRDTITDGVFEDGARMEQLDIVFAGRYLDAWSAYTNTQHCSNAWYTTFEAAKTTDLIVLQHLMLGINAHINLDLGIAAATVAPGEKIFALQNDFEKINDVIASLFDEVQEALSGIWPPLRLLARVAGNHPETVLNFSIDNARKAAWANAQALAFLPANIGATHIGTLDNAVVAVANRIINPGMMANMLLLPVRETEGHVVVNNMDILLING